MSVRFTLILAVSAVVASSSSAQSFGALPYLQAGDSPWASLLGSPTFFLENFEDGLMNTPGVSAGLEEILAPSVVTDSVDGDDGVVDGFGRGGRSFYSSFSHQITFNFNASLLGSLPTRAGIVWTDGQGPTEFRAFGENGQLLGTIVGNHADLDFTGETNEDRFYGWAHAGGISRIQILNQNGGIGLEVDHLQYEVVPEPATMVSLGFGALFLARRRRRVR
jgi:hypothetical protein